MTRPNELRTFLWFGGDMDKALSFYSTTFADAFVINGENRNADTGEIFTADFRIYGHAFIGMNWPGGPKFNEAISLSIQTDGQAETDRLWDALTRDGEPGQCGWCTDPFGVTWQVSPFQMREWLEHPDAEVREYATTALRGMTKIVVDELHR